MADINNLIDIEGLSHFKAKQDVENAKKFKSKDDATDLKGAVRYDAAQFLSDEEKAQARANIGVGTGSGGGSAEGAVRYDVQQALDDDDKERARKNIGTTDGTWKNMLDKPFYKNTSLQYEWNGNTDGLYSVDLAFFKVYNISSDTPTKEELTGATAKMLYLGLDVKGEIGDDKIIRLNETANGNLIGLYYYSDEVQIPMFAVISTVGNDTFMDTEFSFERTGVYFVGSEDEYFTRYIEKVISVTTIDEDFIPEQVVVVEATVNEETSEVTMTQEVGQILKDYIVGSKPTYIKAGKYLLRYIGESDGYGCAISLHGKYSIYISVDLSRFVNGAYKGTISDIQYAALDENGKIPANKLPSYVDDVVEGYFNSEDSLFYKEAEFTTAIISEGGKIYIDLNTSNTYRWSGTQYVRINPDEYTIATNADIDALFT